MSVELDRIDGIVPEWEQLAYASGCPFATVEWTEAWLEHAAGPYAPHLFLARDHEGRPAAIVPLVIAQGRYVRKARLLGFRAANQVGAICSPGDAELGVEALQQALRQTCRDWDVFVAEKLPGTGWGKRLRAKVIGSKGTPLVHGPWTTWDDYLATRSHNLRSELRRKERRLQEQDMRHHTVRTAEELEPAMDALFDLHRRRWGSEASPFFSRLEPFHGAFAAAAFARGWVRLHVFEIDGRPLAANYSLRYGDAEWSYQLGRDLRLEHASVGLIASAIAVREAFAEGASEFRLGPGEQAYKLRLANEDSKLETVGIGRGLRGRASLMAARRRE